MERLDRRIGQRRDATRAPIQARNGWRPSGRLLVTPPHHLRRAEILSNLWGPPHHTHSRQASHSPSLHGHPARSAAENNASRRPVVKLREGVGSRRWEDHNARMNAFSTRRVDGSHLVHDQSQHQGGCAMTHNHRDSEANHYTPDLWSRRSAVRSVYTAAAVYAFPLPKPGKVTSWRMMLSSWQLPDPSQRDSRPFAHQLRS